MKVGWVGAGADKFTEVTEAIAKSLIRASLAAGDTVISGHSPVGGIDIWAEEIAAELHLEKTIFSPQIYQWEPPDGYGFKARNLDIAKHSETLHIAVLAAYPPDYKGRGFSGCYHCARGGEQRWHVKSGGCWTGLRAREFGNRVVWHVI